MDELTIKFYKWDKDFKKFFHTCKKYLNIYNSQFYFPILSLYIYYHNTKNSHKKIDLDRRYILKEILNIDYLKYYNSNSIIKSTIFDNKLKIYNQEELFCKCMPLLDPLHFIMNNYNNIYKRNSLLPSNYNFNTFDKLNDMNNNAYIDTFFGYLCSELTINNISPSFSKFYGTVNGISNKFHYDITEEYDEIKNEKWFSRNLGKLFTIDMYVDSDDDESNSSLNSSLKSSNKSLKSSNKSSNKSSKSSNKSSNKSSKNSLNSSCDSSISENNNDYICIIKDIPVQFFFIEKLDGTMEDFLTEEDVNKDLLLSCILQISIALHLLQKKFLFTHNDLHINNIMYTKTDKTYLYYKFNNIYFKVPTFGYIFKIIDFGRSIFTFNNKVFFNDTFDRHGEAEGQYTYPNKHLLFMNDNSDFIQPNFNFDLCRLAITILDEINLENSDENKEFIDFIKSLTLSNENEYLYKLDDNFDMYIEIAKKANNSRPCEIIKNNIFNKFRIKKKQFPKKNYYSC